MYGSGAGQPAPSLYTKGLKPLCDMTNVIRQSTSVSEGDWGPVAGVLDRGNKLGKSSHSCGKLHYCEDKE